MTNKSRTLLFFTFFSTLFLILSSLCLTLLSGTYIVSDLGGSHDIAIYAFAFFGVGTAVGLPLGHQFLHRIGVVKLYAICLLLFILFSLLGSSASDYPSFLLSRFLEGCVSAPLFIVINYLFTNLTPQEKKVSFASISFAFFVISPIIGSCWGGWIAYDYHWRYLFYFDALFAFLIFFVICAKLKNEDVQPQEKPLPFNAIGWIFYTIGITSLSFVLITGQEFDWFRSNLIVLLAAIGFLSTLFFILWDLNHPNPIIELRLLKQGTFAFATFNLIFLFATYFGIVIMLSNWLILYVNYTPIWLGFLLGIMIVAGFVSVFVTQKKFGNLDPRIPLAIAIIFFGISCFYTSMFNVEINLERVVISRILAGFGLTLFLPPIRKLYAESSFHMQTLPTEVFFHVMRSLASAVGASLYQIIWQRREVFYHERLGSQLTVFSTQTQEFFANAKQFQLYGLKSDAQLDYFLERQSFALALDDCFYLMGWVMVALLVILIFTFLIKNFGFKKLTQPALTKFK